MAYTAINFVPSYIGKLITQASHGFTLGQIVELSGGTWVLAKADTQSDAMSVGMVYGPIDTNTFVLVQTGWVYGFTPGTFVAGTLYYLSGSSAGALSTTPGTITLPLFYADTTQSGYFMNSYPFYGSDVPSTTWNLETTNVASMTPQNGYFMKGTSTQLTIGLPVTIPFGSTFIVNSYSTHGTMITQNASQNILYGNQFTTTGTGGNLSSTTLGDSVTLVCVVPNTTLQVISSMGNWALT